MQAGKGILATTVMSSMNTSFVSASENKPLYDTPKRDLINVQLTSVYAPSEKQETLPAVIERDNRVGFCIVGLGHLSLGQILPAFGKSKYARPVALVSGDAAKATKVAAQYGIESKNLYNYKNFDSIKDNKEIEVVYIVLPNSMHEEFVMRAALAGKDILCEKPMSTTSAAAQRMTDNCNKLGKKLMIAYRIQYEPHHNQIMQWARSQEFGKVKLIESTNTQNMGDPAQWRLNKSFAGGGPLPDMGIYNTNTTRFILGEEPEWVQANVYKPGNDVRFKEVEQNIMFQMGFPSGVLAYGGADYSVHKSSRYRCYTENGAWFGMDPSFEYNGLQMELSQVKGKFQNQQKILMEEKNQFALELDHMAWCVINNHRPFTPGEEGIQDHKIIEALYKSAADGKIIKLDKITTLDTYRGTKPENVS